MKTGTEKCWSYWGRLALFIILAVLLNHGLYRLSVTLKLPLYLDTVFNAAVCFSFGLLPGLITALLTHLTASIPQPSVSPFVLCAIVEVLLIWRLNPVKAGRNKPVSLVNVFAGLLLLYIVCLVLMSVLGGLIDYVYYGVLKNIKPYLSAEDVIKLGLLRSNLQTLAVNILSRISINTVDRFIVVFGGFFVSRGINKLNILKKKYKPMG